MGDVVEAKVNVEDSSFPLTDTDRLVLSQTDEEFHCHGWDEVREIINTNNLSILKRKPSDLRRYMTWTAETKVQYGSMANYILQHRLPWGAPPFTYNSVTPFADSSDYKVLINDWPYGLSNDIRHLVVWSKTPIPTDERTGNVTDESRRVIKDYVKKTFVDRLDGDEGRVLWFKNWVQLQSVRALEHVHVLVRNASGEDLEHWTGDA